MPPQSSYQGQFGIKVSIKKDIFCQIVDTCPKSKLSFGGIVGPLGVKKPPLVWRAGISLFTPLSYGAPRLNLGWVHCSGRITLGSYMLFWKLFHQIWGQIFSKRTSRTPNMRRPENWTLPRLGAKLDRGKQRDPRWLGHIVGCYILHVLSSPLHLVPHLTDGPARFTRASRATWAFISAHAEIGASFVLIRSRSVAYLSIELYRGIMLVNRRRFCRTVDVMALEGAVARIISPLQVNIRLVHNSRRKLENSGLMRDAIDPYVEITRYYLSNQSTLYCNEPNHIIKVQIIS